MKTALTMRKPAAARTGRAETAEKGIGEAVNPLAVLPLRGRDGQPHLLAECAADEPTHAVRLPIRCGHDFVQGDAPGPLHQVNNLSRLAALTRSAGLLFRLRTLGGFGRLLGRRGLLARLGLRGPALWLRWRGTGLRTGLRLLRNGRGRRFLHFRVRCSHSRFDLLCLLITARS